MEYIVTSGNAVYGKAHGEKLTKDDILSAGGNVEHLLASGNIKTANAAKVTPAVPQATRQEEVPVFNSVNNEQGEK